MILTYLLLTSFHNFSLSQTDQSSYFCHLSKRREIWRNIMAALAEEMQFANKLDQNQQPSSLTSAATAQQPKKKKTKLKVRSKSNPVMDASFLLRVFVVVYRYFVMFYDMIIFLYLWVLFLFIYLLFCWNYNDGSSMYVYMNPGLWKCYGEIWLKTSWERLLLLIFSSCLITS